MFMTWMVQTKRLSAAFFTRVQARAFSVVLLLEHVKGELGGGVHGLYGRGSLAIIFLLRAGTWFLPLPRGFLFFRVLIISLLTTYTHLPFFFFPTVTSRTHHTTFLSPFPCHDPHDPVIYVFDRDLKM